MAQLLISQITVQKLIKYLDNQSSLFIVGVSLILTLLIAALDFFLIKADISCSLLYLIPILLVTWWESHRWGFVFSILSGGLGFWVDWLVHGNTNLTQIFAWRWLIYSIFYILITYLLSIYKTKYQLVQRLDRNDQLTGIYNRRFFWVLAQIEINRLQRYNRPLTIFLIDIDRLHEFNRNFGFQQGDKLLCAIGNTLSKNIRLTDFVARIGGDEFVILYPETDYLSSQIAIKRMRQRLLSTIAEEQWPVTFSIGGVTFVNQILSVQQMLEQADSLLYAAKQIGKNQLQHQLIDELPTLD